MTRATGAGALACKALAVACALGLALAGCARPEPEPYVPSETSTPTPTPTWDAEQARAIDALQRYIDLWAEISQNLYTADRNRIFEVADGVVADAAINNWADWAADDLRFVGAPVITVDSVVLGYFDSQSGQYHVGVCYDRTNAHLVNPDGTQIAGQLADRSRGTYTVEVSSQGPDRVIGVRMEEGTC